MSQRSVLRSQHTNHLYYEQIQLPPSQLDDSDSDARPSIAYFRPRKRMRRPPKYVSTSDEDNGDFDLLRNGAMATTTTKRKTAPGNNDNASCKPKPKAAKVVKDSGIANKKKEKPRTPRKKKQPNLEKVVAEAEKFQDAMEGLPFAQLAAGLPSQRDEQVEEAEKMGKQPCAPIPEIIELTSDESDKPLVSKKPKTDSHATTWDPFGLQNSHRDSGTREDQADNALKRENEKLQRALAAALDEINALKEERTRATNEYDELKKEADNARSEISDVREKLELETRKAEQMINVKLRLGEERDDARQDANKAENKLKEEQEKHRMDIADMERQLTTVTAERDHLDRLLRQAEAEKHTENGESRDTELKNLNHSLQEEIKKQKWERTEMESFYNGEAGKLKEKIRFLDNQLHEATSAFSNHEVNSQTATPQSNSHDMEQKYQNVRKAFTRINQKWGSLFGVAREVASMSSGMQFGNMGDWGRALKRLKIEIDGNANGPSPESTEEEGSERSFGVIE